MNPHLRGGRVENHFRKKPPPVHPTEIRTSIFPSSVVWLNTTGAFSMKRPRVLVVCSVVLLALLAVAVGLYFGLRPTLDDDTGLNPRNPTSPLPPSDSPMGVFWDASVATNGYPCAIIGRIAAASPIILPAVTLARPSVEGLKLVKGTQRDPCNVESLFSYRSVVRGLCTAT
uniref:Uncharacterized protein n=1 Tax=Timema genevievae TaxID=629358 RepID=A0A7R9K8W2_TIMGE|nr:unnamed protein product [Timema genevievae]